MVLRMKRSRGIVLSSAALAAVATLVAVPRAGGGLAAKPRWQNFPIKARHLWGPYIKPFWANGRFWFLVHYLGGRETTVVSAARSGGKLTAFRTSSLPGGTIDYPDLVSSSNVGSSIIYNPLDQNWGRLPAQMAPLLSNGRVGEAQPLPGDPQGTIQRQLPTWRQSNIWSGVRVGGRFVWFLASGQNGIAVCCSTAGKAVELTSMMRNRRWGAWDLKLALDGRGRLWAFWVDHKNNSGKGTGANVHVVQLDPTSLAPSLSRVLASTTRRFVGKTWVDGSYLLACSASCRVVLFPRTGTYTWAPGERAPTKISGTGKAVLSAAYRGGRLVLSYEVTNKGGVQRIFAASGDALGRGLGHGSSIAPPQQLRSGSVQTLTPPSAASTPAGAVVLQTYGPSGRPYDGGAALVAFLPTP
jgi:hypothetical protein